VKEVGGFVVEQMRVSVFVVLGDREGKSLGVDMVGGVYSGERSLMCVLYEMLRRNVYKNRTRWCSRKEIYRITASSYQHSIGTLAQAKCRQWR
jgi:hypothetical protein